MPELAVRGFVMGRIGRQGLDVESCWSTAAQPESQPHLSSARRNCRRNSEDVITLAKVAPYEEYTPVLEDKKPKPNSNPPTPLQRGHASLTHLSVHRED